MATMMPPLSTCENPQYPNWAWRYNRDKHLSRFEPLYYRTERAAPQYRNMGVKDDFRFHPEEVSAGSPPAIQTGLTYCKRLNQDRVAGFGNAGLGIPPGPAPPRVMQYWSQPSKASVGELYRVNEIHHISRGMSLLDNSNITWVNDEEEPLNPRQYLEQTLGQTREFPGTFPHFNVAAKSSKCPPRECQNGGNNEERDLMAVWRKSYRNQLNRQAQERAASGPQTVLPSVRGCSNTVPSWVGAGPLSCNLTQRKLY